MDLSRLVLVVLQLFATVSVVQNLLYYIMVMKKKSFLNNGGSIEILCNKCDVRF